VGYQISGKLDGDSRVFSSTINSALPFGGDVIGRSPEAVRRDSIGPGSQACL
jgi:hypothetical protein